MVTLVRVGTALLLTVLLTGASCNGPEIVSVTIAEGNRSLLVGEELALSATVVAVGGASDAVMWSSSDAGVASVSATGVVSGVAVGSASITAASVFDGSKSDSIAVSVTAAAPPPPPQPPEPTALVPVDGDCGATAVGARCDVTVALQSNTRAWQGAEFDIDNPRFGLVGVAASDLTDGCLLEAGLQRVGIICTSTFGGEGSVALVTFERDEVGPSSFTLSSAKLLDADANEVAVDGGRLDVP